MLYMLTVHIDIKKSILLQRDAVLQGDKSRWKFRSVVCSQRRTFEININ